MYLAASEERAGDNEISSSVDVNTAHNHTSALPRARLRRLPLADVAFGIPTAANDILLVIQLCRAAKCR